MSKIGYYLQEHLSGEVIESMAARDYFASDGSSISIKPLVITYPADERDVRKITRFSWQLAERGRDLPITARGNGTDLSGAAIGSGLMVVFPAHMNKLLRLDVKNSTVIVEPGMNFSKLNQTLKTHGYFLPFEPSSGEYSSIGGAIANNASGRYSVKYKNALNYVRSLRVVLSNGDVIETYPLSNKDLNKKMGQVNFEGEIYRAVDAILEEHQDLSELAKNININAGGYNIDKVRTKAGFDLSPLFVGSQGTLGIITELTLQIVPLVIEQDQYLIVQLNSNNQIEETVKILKSMSHPPTFIEMIDQTTLNLVDKISPKLTEGLISKPYPKSLIIVGYADAQKYSEKGLIKAYKLLSKISPSVELTDLDSEIDVKHKIDTINSHILNYFDSNKHPSPILRDLIVPTNQVANLLNGIDQMTEKMHSQNAIFGRIGDGMLQVQPLLDLSQTADRQKFFKYLNEGSSLVAQLGGSINASGGEGRLKVFNMTNEYSEKMLSTFRKLKYVFDPLNILNPGVKFNTTEEDIKNILNHKFKPKWLDHLPRY